MKIVKRIKTQKSKENNTDGKNLNKSKTEEIKSNEILKNTNSPKLVVDTKRSFSKKKSLTYNSMLKMLYQDFNNKNSGQSKSSKLFKPYSKN